MDPSSFANTSPRALTPNRSYGLEASVIRGFDQRRFDQLAIVRLVLQPWIKVLPVTDSLNVQQVRADSPFPV
ncbi:hypothetical protein OKW33_003412 [Paraburkholderia atlantica]|uniref:Uncharacterized protein n=1 Tax=Paraburkholderia atlantica TaxID=2654982 RepID=A0A7W8QBA2_PARAM|nr:hypothetical protein [Paraburkholderia atlantica]MBB5417274.1 hypothetical protein [Paraburkholderia atlantica]MBB5427243.1 hypothetical protein [Paraburkholderia atlantica]NUY33573.1 hypothetical protein [Paraburkholderia atlantica]